MRTPKRGCRCWGDFRDVLGLRQRVPHLYEVNRERVEAENRYASASTYAAPSALRGDLPSRGNSTQHDARERGQMLPSLLELHQVSTG